jgi:hypothetical protein
MRHLAAIALLLAAAPVAAQSHEHAHETPAAAGATAQPRPEGWVVRVDRPDRATPDQVAFTAMAPGWHVTTGPAALMYLPGSTASGDFHLESTMHLFDPGERNEGYGVFFGGSDMDGAGQRYTYFLLRQDGRFLIKVRNGDATSVVRDWTEHPSIHTWAARTDGAASVENQLVVHVQGSDVQFIVNGAVVAQVPRAELPATDGAYGLRVNHSLNLHVATLVANAL